MNEKFGQLLGQLLLSEKFGQLLLLNKNYNIWATHIVPL